MATFVRSHTPGSSSSSGSTISATLAADVSAGATLIVVTGRGTSASAEASSSPTVPGDETATWTTVSVVDMTNSAGTARSRQTVWVITTTVPWANGFSVTATWPAADTNRYMLLAEWSGLSTTVVGVPTTNAANNANAAARAVDTSAQPDLQPGDVVIETVNLQSGVATATVTRGGTASATVTVTPDVLTSGLRGYLAGHLVSSIGNRSASFVPSSAVPRGIQLFGLRASGPPTATVTGTASSAGFATAVAAAVVSIAGAATGAGVAAATTTPVYERTAASSSSGVASAAVVPVGVATAAASSQGVASAGTVPSVAVDGDATSTGAATATTVGYVIAVVDAQATSSGLAIAAIDGTPSIAALPTSSGLASATISVVATLDATATSAGTTTAGIATVENRTGQAASTGQATAAAEIIPFRDATATSTGTATATIAAVRVATGTATSAGQASAAAVNGDLSRTGTAISRGTATALITREGTDESTSTGGDNPRGRIGYGAATWEPPVVEAPATLAPVHARIAAHAYTSVTMNGTRPQMTGLITTDKPRQADRIVIAGRDVTYFRGTPTPLPRFGLVSPLLWGSGTLELPQVAACFETPGEGSLSWLREGAPVLIQRVQDGAVVATDYRGIILGFGTNGRSLTVDLGGDALGRASLRDKQPPIFKRRNDLGWWWWNALAGPDGIDRPFGKVGGPTTGINLYDTGGTRFVDYLNELAARGTNLAGTQWTCTPFETGAQAGTYRVHRKDTETIDATVYLDDAHTVASLQADASERPNRIFGTGVTPKGERARFGVYPVLAEKQAARFGNYISGQPIEQGDTNADTDTGGGVTALLHRLSVTGYLAADAFAGGYDIDVTRAVRDLQDDAGLPKTGDVDLATWRALFDVDTVGYSTRGSRIEPIAQAGSVKRVRRNASGQVIGVNPGYISQRLVVDRTIDFGTGITRGQMRDWARADLGSETPGSTPSVNGRHWTGTIRFELGAVIKGTHTPGDPVAVGDLMHARALRPGMNLWLPLFDGGTQVHVSGVDVDSEQQVTVAVDTRARDTMTVWEVIARNQENKRQPARAWIRDHRSSSFVKDAVTEFDEIGGTISDQQFDAGWNVFPVVAGQEGTIARMRLRTLLPVEFVVAVFGRRVGTKWLAQQVSNPLTAAGSQRWENEAVRAKLDKNILLYAAGNNEQPGGYSPNQKATSSDPGGPLTGRFDDDAGFGYRTFDQSCILWVAVYCAAATTLQGGRIMWPQLESGA